MKKIFAICAVACVAAAMFVSCGGKTEEGTVSVKFNKEQWTAGEVLGNQVENVLGMEAYENSVTDHACAFVYGTLGTEPGTYNNYVFSYMENYDDVDAEGYPNWGVDSHNQEISAIDLAAHTIDAEIIETLKQEGKDNADLKITMNNATWTVDTAVLVKSVKRR